MTELTSLAAWKSLEKDHLEVGSLPRRDFFARDAVRFDRYALGLAAPRSDDSNN